MSILPTIALNLTIEKAEALVLMITYAMNSDGETLEDKLLNAALLEIKVKLQQKLILPQRNTLRLPLHPAQACACALLTTYSFNDMYHNHIALSLQRMLPTKLF